MCLYQELEAETVKIKSKTFFLGYLTPLFKDSTTTKSPYGISVKISPIKYETFTIYADGKEFTSNNILPLGVTVHTFPHPGMLLVLVPAESVVLTSIGSFTCTNYIIPYTKVVERFITLDPKLLTALENFFNATFNQERI